MLELMKQEFDRRKHELKEPVETIYFGGGSPGLLTPKELEMLLKEPLSLAGNQLRELTLEANPEDVTEPNLTAWKNLGINRISLGVQSTGQPKIIFPYPQRQIREESKSGRGRMRFSDHNYW